jgi:subtilisin family serine protease
MTEDNDFIGDFSNYGQETVDIFAPGVNVYSLVPDNKYGAKSGTSMACPVVTGVAAVLWSYYPELNALQIKDILLKSSTKHKKLKVFLPGIPGSKRKTVKFSKLSVTGGIVNLYNALNLAEDISTN